MPLSCGAYESLTRKERLMTWKMLLGRKLVTFLLVAASNCRLLLVLTVRFAHLSVLLLILESLC